MDSTTVVAALAGRYRPEEGFSECFARPLSTGCQPEVRGNGLRRSSSGPASRPSSEAITGTRLTSRWKMVRGRTRITVVLLQMIVRGRKAVVEKLLAERILSRLVEPQNNLVEDLGQMLLGALKPFLFRKRLGHCDTLAFRVLEHLCPSPARADGARNGTGPRVRRGSAAYPRSTIRACGYPRLPNSSRNPAKKPENCPNAQKRRPRGKPRGPLSIPGQNEHAANQGAVLARWAVAVHRHATDTAAAHATMLGCCGPDGYRTAKRRTVGRGGHRPPATIRT